MSRILIVDDDQRTVQVLSDSFNHVYTVEIAMNAGEALAIVRRQRPDLVLLDVMLPGVSGMHLLRELKRIAPTMAVVIVTGSGNVGLAAEGRCESSRPVRGTLSRRIAPACAMRASDPRHAKPPQNTGSS
jgi:DNA-binding NtrC family response regulator